MRPALPSALLLAVPARADLPDSREAFRTEMEATRRILATARAGKAGAAANPFGSGSCGVSLATLTTPGVTDRMACVLDKRARHAEPTAPFSPWPEG